MKKCILIVFLFLLPYFAIAQIVSIFAGGGTSGTGEGGPATAATLIDPGEGIFDKNGSYYFASATGNRIQKIDNSGIITTIAGVGIGGFSGDGGAATLAKLYLPSDLKFDTLGNLYISDAGNNRVRKIDHSSGIISTVAGNGTSGYGGDGLQATAAALNNPLCLCFDKTGNLFISDNQNNRIRKINASGMISTFAGTGVYGYTGDNGAATAAQLWLPWGLAIDKEGSLYISDLGSHRIRKVNNIGIITTFAGNGNDTYDGDGIPALNAQFFPAEIAFNSFGELFVGDFAKNYRLLMIDNAGIIHSIAGNGIAGHSGDGGLATNAEFNYPPSVTFDSCGNLYIPDVGATNGTIRKVTYPKCGYLEVPEVNDNKISIYPNPTYDQININNLQAPATYKLLNIIGATMQQGVLIKDNNSISMQALPNGMYMLEVTDDEGKKSVSKIVRQ